MKISDLISMPLRRKGVLSLALLMLCNVTAVFGAQLDVFGTVSMQLEHVSPGKSNTKNYTALRDIYTRVALQFTHDLNEDLQFLALLEMPFDTVNLEVQHAWDQKEDIIDNNERIAKLQLSSSRYGAVSVGKGWVPYYFAVSAAVDRFSSYYSGYSTYSTLRQDELFIYSSPNFNGFKFNLARAHKNGDREKNGSFDDRDQITISYANSEVTAGLAMEDIGGENNRRIFGASVSRKMGDFYVAAKYEEQQSDITDKSIFGYDGSKAVNFYAEYAWGDHKVKGLVAKINGFGEGVFHLGYDYYINPNLKLFTEYFSEEKGAAISTKKGGFRDTYFADGGSAFLVGFNYSFEKNLF